MDEAFTLTSNQKIIVDFLAKGEDMLASRADKVTTLFTLGLFAAVKEAQDKKTDIPPVVKSAIIGLMADTFALISKAITNAAP